MQAVNLMLEVRSREDNLAAAKQRCDSLEKYMQEVLAQNEQFRLQDCVYKYCLCVYHGKSYRAEPTPGKVCPSI